MKKCNKNSASLAIPFEIVSQSSSVTSRIRSAGKYCPCELTCSGNDEDDDDDDQRGFFERCCAALCFSCTVIVLQETPRNPREIQLSAM